MSIVKRSGPLSNMNIADSQQHKYLPYTSEIKFSDTLIYVYKVIMIKISIKWNLQRYKQSQTKGVKAPSVTGSL